MNKYIVQSEDHHWVVLIKKYLQNMWHSLEELQQLREAIVGDAALLGKVMMI